ncbi:MAG: sporulation protein YunB [Eubacteriales bacterium]|nr:sporulation protein YunB [Eubacteriales bacterium]MDD7506063.1 sporulation protein YunB [Clostridiales bacterium]MDY5726412.1 sporulation protein YunB [Eubacteriales bacterium]
MSKSLKSSPLKKLKKGIILAVIFLVIVVVCIYTLNSVSPTIVAFSEAKIKSLTTAAVNSAIFEVMLEPISYSDLVSIEKNADGEITLIAANSMIINKLARDMAQSTETYIEKMGEQDVKIPIGTLSGSPLLAGKGFKVTIRVLPLGSVKCQFVSEFETAGINQTRHKIYLDVVATISIVLPTSQSIVKTNTPVLVSESIIVGKVPDTYLSAGSIFGQDYDLTP